METDRKKSQVKLWRTTWFPIFCLLPKPVFSSVLENAVLWQKGRGNLETGDLKLHLPSGSVSSPLQVESKRLLTKKISVLFWLKLIDSSCLRKLVKTESHLFSTAFWTNVYDLSAGLKAHHNHIHRLLVHGHWSLISLHIVKWKRTMPPFGNLPSGKPSGKLAKSKIVSCGTFFFWVPFYPSIFILLLLWTNQPEVGIKLHCYGRMKASYTEIDSPVFAHTRCTHFHPPPPPIFCVSLFAWEKTARKL